MPSITIKNIPEDLYERLKEAARTHRRSINSEVIVCIEKAIGSHKVDVEAEITAARALREKASDYYLTDDDLDQFKTEGRP
jgi:plasmid stability protein